MSAEPGRRPPAEAQLRLGVIGAGIMGADHVATLTGAVSGAVVTAVCDADLTRAEAAAAGPWARTTADPAAVIGADDVDAVLVASSDDSHEALVLACLDRAVPVLCEKPLTPTVEGCARILAAQSRLERPLVQVGFMRRYDPSYTALRDALRRNTIGAALVVHNVHRNVSASPGSTTASMLANSLTHEIDVLRWLTGEEVASVCVHSPRPSTWAGRGLRDPQVVVLTTTGGVVATVELFLNARYGYEVGCEVVGEQGTLTLHAPERVTTRSAAVGRSVGYPTDWRPRFADAYRIELQSWVDGVRAGTPVTGPGAFDGYAATAVAHACIAASRTPGVTLEVALGSPHH